MQYDNQGKRREQIQFSEKVMCYAIIGISIMIGIYAIVQTVSIFYESLN